METPNYSPEQIEGFEASRKASDEDLKKGGAKAVVTTRLEITPEQEKEIKKTHADEISERKALERELASLEAKAEQIKAKLSKFPKGNKEKETKSEKFPSFEASQNPEITSAKKAIDFLKEQGFEVDDYTKDLLEEVNWKEKLKSSYEVVSVSVDDLFGDGRSHTYKEIKEKADECGLALTPASLAPVIRAKYPKGGKWTTLAMEAIRDRDSDPSLFRCHSNDSGSWLDSDHNGRDDFGWRPGFRFFFVRK